MTDPVAVDPVDAVVQSPPLSNEEIAPVKEEVIIISPIDTIPLPQPFSFPGLDRWPLARLPTISDKNNFYHSVLQCYFTPYMVGIYNGVATTKEGIAEAISNLVYNQLWVPYSNVDNLGVKNYQMVDPTLVNMNLQRVALQLENVCRIPYLPGEAINRKYLWHVCHQLNINIYILDAERNVCISADNSDSRAMRSICLLWKDGFFRSVGLRLDNGGHASYFEKGNEFSNMLQFLSASNRAGGSTQVPF